MGNPYLQAVLAVDRWRWAERHFDEFRQLVDSAGQPNDLAAEIDSRIAESRANYKLTLDK